MDRELLEKNARYLVSPGRGILAADESNGTMSNRLEAVGVKASSETRRAYRLISSPQRVMNLQLVALSYSMKQSVRQ